MYIQSASLCELSYLEVKTPKGNLTLGKTTVTAQKVQNVSLQISLLIV